VKQLTQLSTRIRRQCGVPYPIVAAGTAFVGTAPELAIGQRIGSPIFDPCEPYRMSASAAIEVARFTGGKSEFSDWDCRWCNQLRWLAGQHPIPKEVGRVTSGVAFQNPTHASLLPTDYSRSFLE